jgi:hypothetical protein
MCIVFVICLDASTRAQRGTHRTEPFFLLLFAYATNAHVFCSFFFEMERMSDGNMAHSLRNVDIVDVSRCFVRLDSSSQRICFLRKEYK